MLKNENSHILIVEDSPIQAAFLKKILLKKGYSVSIAKNGIDGLVKVREISPALVISDIAMPEMNGYEMCAEIKGDRELRFIPVILLTELNNPKEIIRGLEVGADNYLTKPYSEEYLLHKIESILLDAADHGDDLTIESLELNYDGERHILRSGRRQILNLLLTTYESAVNQNRTLSQTQLELRILNESLEEKVRKRTWELRERVDREKFIADLSTKFINLLPGDVEREIEAGLQSIGEFLKADRGILEQFTEEGFFLLHTPCRDLGDSQIRSECMSFCREKSGWFRTMVDKGDNIVISDVNDAPFEAGAILKEQGVKSMIAAPLYYGGIAKGLLRFENLETVREWSNDDSMMLRMLGEVFVNTLERKRISETKATMLMNLEEANNELNSFVYILSHDLRSPLRAIGSLADIIADDYAHCFDKEGRNNLEMLTGRVQRMYNLLDGILQYSKAGRVVEKREVLDLNILVSDIISKIKPGKGTDIAVTAELPTILSEKNGIEIVFSNLLDNSIKYMDKPGGKILIECIEESRFWKFSINDNGPGIEERHYEKIFKVFQTLSPRDEVEGAGLGLSLARKIVRALGGNIWVSSEVGKGSTFFFTLPKQ